MPVDATREDVVRLVAGKVEWLAYGLPRERTATAEPVVADVAG